MDVDIIVITELINFLTPFEIVTDQLQGDHHPTLQKVFLCAS